MATLTLEDGWTTDSSDRKKLHAFVTAHSTPRPFGFLDQLRRDFRSISGLLYLACLASVVAGVIQRQLILLLWPLGVGLLVGRSMRELVHLNRDGVLVTLVATTRATGSRNKVTAQLTVDGETKTLDVIFPGVVANDLIDRYGAIEILAIVNLDTLETPRAINHAWLAFRPAAREVQQSTSPTSTPGPGA